MSDISDFDFDFLFETELEPISDEILSVLEDNNFEQFGGSIQSEPLLNFIKVSESSYKSTRFHRQTKRTLFRVNHNLSQLADLLEVEDQIDDAFFKIIEENTTNAKLNDIISVSIDNENLITPIFISKKKQFIRREDVLNRIEKICQSSRSFLIDGILDFEVSVTECLSGRGRLSKRKLPISLKDYRSKKRCIKFVTNNDNSCGYRAIALGYIDKVMSRKRLTRKQKRNMKSLESKIAKKLCQDLQLNINNELDMNGLETFSAFFESLDPPIELVVVNGRTKLKEFGGNKQSIQIYIELFEKHYNYISSIQAYFERSYFCSKCFVGFNDKSNHNCPYVCSLCLVSGTCEGDKVLCEKCNRTFNGTQCFTNHKTNEICKKKFKCKKCLIEDTNYSSHQCLLYKCKKCGEIYSSSPHYCFMKPKIIKKLYEEDSRNKIIIAFDIESAILNDDDNELLQMHKPNLLISNTVCDFCFNMNEFKKDEQCKICGDYLKIFSGYSCVEKFADYLYNEMALKASNSKSQLLVFAHNFKGYDGHFLLKDLFARDIVNIEAVMNGSKIIKLCVGNVTFIDSLSFFQLPLSSLPKSFGFEHFVQKGYCPFLLNNKEEIDYVGPIPEMKYFNKDFMKSKDLVAFEQWYIDQIGCIYNLKKEMIKYCKNDVLILLLSILKFREQFKNVTTIDPLTRNFTLASIGLETFRSLFLKPNQLAITPLAGYSQRNSSIIGNIWIDWCSKIQNRDITKEYRVGRFFADGFYEQTQSVYEFFGCRYHGCLECFPNSRSEPSINLDDKIKSYDQLYEQTLEKLKCYQELNLDVNAIWECNFMKFIKDNEHVKLFYDERYKYYQNYKKYGGASIRESFFGGRTNNLRFHYVADINESIEYKDVISEYPYVLKNRKYPIGHPKVIQNNFDYTLKSYFGFVKCKVLAPYNLFLPVLPSRVNGKLMFHLCSKCSRLKYQKNVIILIRRECLLELGALLNF
ncbi:MAG: DNA polymerase [Limnohabitans sp.]|nr:DNA polymerase [Limnohabitans sp.]